MTAILETSMLDLQHPLNVRSQAFIDNKYEYYAWLRENAPVYKGKFHRHDTYIVSRHADCTKIIRNPAFVRTRAKALGRPDRVTSKYFPKSWRPLVYNLFTMDGAEHRRTRSLAREALAPKRLGRLEDGVERLSHALLDELEREDPIDLLSAYALRVPATVIGELVGISVEERDQFFRYTRIISEGPTLRGAVRAMVWELPAAYRLVRQAVRKKRDNPGDDLVTALIESRDNGEALTDDEIAGLIILFIVAGYETTGHLITNGVHVLLDHPHELERLREDEGVAESAIEEILRFRGPAQATRPLFATEDIELAGTTIRKGARVLPLLGAANFDPEAFDDPETFDITRSPNKHMGFGYGAHICLGAPLARLEAKVALRTLVARKPGLRLAVPASELRLVKRGWHSYDTFPVVLG